MASAGPTCWTGASPTPSCSSSSPAKAWARWSRRETTRGRPMSLHELVALDAGSVMATYARLPVAFVRGEGSRLYDSEGPEDLDFLTGFARGSPGAAQP